MCCIQICINGSHTSRSRLLRLLSSTFVVASTLSTSFDSIDLLLLFLLLIAAIIERQQNNLSITFHLFYCPLQLRSRPQPLQPLQPQALSPERCLHLELSTTLTLPRFGVNFLQWHRVQYLYPVQKQDITQDLQRTLPKQKQQ